eukprot:symbB.v1.2.019715.t1/scaffold1571.1/size154223/9
MGQMGREGFGDLVPVVCGVAAKASCLRHGAGAQTLRGSHARPTDARWLSTQEIVDRRPQMVQCVEDGSLNRVSTETFRKIDREGVGWVLGNLRG